MQKTDGIAIAEGAACLLDIIERNNTEALGISDKTIGRYLAAHNALFAIIHREEDRTKEKATLIRELRNQAKGRKEQGDLFDANTKLSKTDVPGQQLLEESEHKEELKAQTDAKPWSISKTSPELAKDHIVESLRAGDGKTKAIENAKAELGLSKFETEAYWDELIAAGRIVKKGKSWIVTDVEPVATEEPIPELSAPVNYEITEEDLVWTEKTSSMLDSSDFVLVSIDKPDLITANEYDELERVSLAKIPGVYVIAQDATLINEESAQFFTMEETSIPKELFKYSHDLSRWIKIHNYAFWLRANGQAEMARHYLEGMAAAEDAFGPNPEETTEEAPDLSNPTEPAI